MDTITLLDIKRHGAKVIPDNTSVYLIVNSKPKSVLVPIEEYKALVSMLEDREDAAAIEERKHEKGIPFEKMFPDFTP